MATAVPEAKKRRTVSVGLRSVDGASLRVSLKIRRDSTVQTWATHKIKGGKAVRGASETHDSMEKAEAAMSALIEKAVKLGWEKKERPGFAPKPDAFDLKTLPKPAK